MTKRAVISVTINDEPVEITLRPANIGDASYHAELLNAGDAIVLDGSHDTFGRKNVGTYLYPHCVACVESPISVREMTLADFMQLDEQELDGWAAKTQELNNHWWASQAKQVMASMAQVVEMSEQAQKKTGTPLSGSPQSTTTNKRRTKASHRSKNSAST